MIVITLSDIIGLVVLGIFIFDIIFYGLYLVVFNFYNHKFKNNCFECKHYYLQDVAGAGDCCWYNCRIHNEYHKDRHSMNDKCMYRKCKDFEKEN